MAAVMIHEARGTLIAAPPKAFQATLDFLTRFNAETVVPLYMRRMNVSEAELHQMLQQERSFTATEAVEVGLADSVIEIEDDNDTDGNEARVFARRNLRLAALAGT